MVNDIKKLVEEFRTGDKESAFFTLLDISGDVLPALMEVFWTERSPKVRAFLVKVAWERREQSLIPFLGKALIENDEEVWQEALDGLVAFSSQESLEVLQSARSRKFKKETAAKRFNRWLEEAIQQVEFELRSKV